MRPTSRSQASGSTCTARSTATAIQSTSCCAPNETRRSSGILRARHRPARRARQDHDRQERRQHGRHRQHPGRQRPTHRNAPVEVPEQPRRARPPRCQTNHPSDARLQDLSLRPNSARRHRGHAHDPQRPTQRNQRPSRVCSEPVLLPGFLNGVGLAAMLGLIALLRQNRRMSLP
jgi:hypothetical protein